VVDDDLAETPKDFTQVSPQSLAIRVKRENFADLVKSLKGQNVQIALDSIATDCNALRSGHQVLRLFIDPARAAALIAS
jgi:Ni,Fe-hydrogenase III component G